MFMRKINQLFASILLVGFLPTYLSPSFAADTVDNRSYGQKVGDKALNGVANLGGGLLEIPKSIILTTNQSNIFYGIVGGLFKGMIQTGGRMGTGIADLITAPIPTKPIAYPYNVWDDFDTETTYGDTFRLDKVNKPQPQVVQLPPPSPVVQVVPVAPIEDRSHLYNSTTNKRLDRVFRKEMMK
jgi:putative exosortase-associated protein (TIGR04073 family)